MPGPFRPDDFLTPASLAMPRQRIVLAKRGVLVCVGHGEGLMLNVSPDLIAPERAVIGSEYFCNSELAKNLERLRSNRDYLGQIVTHRYPVSEIQQAFETFSQQNTGKVVVEQ